MVELEKVVIAGSGAAGVECAVALRMSGFSGPIILLSAERTMPYGLPPLSKAYLNGSAGLTDIEIRPAETYHEHDILVRPDARVLSIDRGEQRVQLADGSSQPYDWLVLATGGSPRTLPATVVADGAGVQYLRTLADADALRRVLPGARLVVVGGGYLGLEVAAAARKLHCEVTVVEAAQRLLARVSAPPVSAFFSRLHDEEGVDVRLGTSVLRVGADPGGDLQHVELADGEQLVADVVLASIGPLPSVQLAVDAGLEVNDGIVVDEYCRTSDPRILAAGDCTRHPCFETGGSRRLESLPNAMQQGEIAAASILGRTTAYTNTPWFWSEQYDVTLQSVGLLHHDDEIVIRGNSDVGRSFSTFFLRNGEVRAADVVSNPREFAFAKRLVTQRRVVDPEQLRDPSFELSQLVSRVRRESATASNAV